MKLLALPFVQFFGSSAENYLTVPEFPENVTPIINFIASEVARTSPLMCNYWPVPILTPGNSLIIKDFFNSCAGSSAEYSKHTLAS